jgi:uncharacterized membrane protein
MPDLLSLVEAVSVAAVVAGIIQLLAWWIPGALRRALAAALRTGPPSQHSPMQQSGPQPHSGRPGASRIAVGGALGAGIGFVAGACALGQQPSWPLAEDHDRLLAVLLPAAVIVECVAAVQRGHPWLAWSLRFVLSAAAAPILLYGSTYVSEVAGSRAWTNAEMVAWLAGLAVSLVVIWMAAVRLLPTGLGRMLPFALSGAAAAACVTVMLSGYMTGGELALPLAGAVGGAAVAALILRMLRCDTGVVGVGVVGLFAVLVIGRFFGTLSTVHGAILLAAPLLVCVPELLPRKNSSPWLHGALAVVLLVIPITFVIAQAREKFVQESASSSSPEGTSADEYLEYK